MSYSLTHFYSFSFYYLWYQKLFKTKKKQTKLILAKYKKVAPKNDRYNEKIKVNKERFYENFISIKPSDIIL